MRRNTLNELIINKCEVGKANPAQVKVGGGGWKNLVNRLFMFKAFVSI